jgi:hypothetical protein
MGGWSQIIYLNIDASCWILKAYLEGKDLVVPINLILIMGN